MYFTKFPYKRVTVFRGLLFSTLLPCFFATLLLAVVFLPMLLSTAEKTDEAYEEFLLVNTAGQMNAVCEIVDMVTAQIEDSEWIYPLFFDFISGGKIAHTTKTEITLDLAEVVAKYDVLFSAAFRFYGDDYTLYTDMGVFENISYFQEQFPEKSQYFFYPAETQTPTFSEIEFNGQQYLLYQAPFRDIPQGRYKGEINLLFRSNILGNSLHEAAEKQAIAFHLTDETGTILWEHDIELPQKNTVSLQTKISDDLFLSIDLPNHIHKQTRNVVIPLTVLTLTLSLVISCTICYFLSKVTYRPFQHIFGKFVGPEQQSDNEFSVLEQVFDGILSERSEMQTFLNKLRPLAHQKVLGSLLDGTMLLGDSVDDQLQYCGIRFAYTQFNVVDVEFPFSQICSQDESISELVMATFFEHLATGLSLTAHLYYEDSDHYHVIVNYNEHCVFLEYLQMLEDNCRNYLQRHEIDVWFYIGIGQATDAIDDLYRSAEQASTSINYAIVNRIGNALFYDEIASKTSYDYFYPLSEEVLLSKAISNGNAESAKSLLYSIIEQNRQKESLSPKALQLMYMDLTSTVARSAQGLGISVPLFSQKQRIISLDEILQSVENMIEDICIELQAMRDKTISTTEAKILSYIDAHVFDPDLSLKGIAEEFEKSIAYISLLFKEQRGTNYNTYVNQTRILHAIQLMSEQNLEAEDVYVKVGYVSLSAFRRNFTKYAKCNPGVMTKISSADYRQLKDLP